MGSRFSHVEWWGDAVEGGLLLLRYVWEREESQYR